jgi:transcriptional regulator with XRE-family HTH domain
MDALMTACFNIKKVRTVRGYRQQDMADKLNVNLKSYQNLENGIAKLDLERLTQVAEVLDVSIFDLLKPDEVFVHQEIQANENIYNKEVTINNDISQSERKLFEKIIEDKDKEIAYLRDLLAKK